MKNAPNVPIGVRLNNPGNLEWGDPWQGLVPRAESLYFQVGNAQQKRFAQFTSPVYGIRAIARTLITYQDKYNIRTIRAVITRWAPPVENNSTAYINQVASHVAKSLGRPFSDGEEIDVHDYATLRPIVEAIIRHENGPGPLKNKNGWYADEVIDEGLRLAGVVKQCAKVRKVPVTKETVAATGTASLGIAQIADVAPAVLAAMNQSDEHLSSGSVVRIVIGLLTIGLAGFIAWSQMKKHKAGVIA